MNTKWIRTAGLLLLAGVLSVPFIWRLPGKADQSLPLPLPVPVSSTPARPTVDPAKGIVDGAGKFTAKAGDVPLTASAARKQLHEALQMEPLDEHRFRMGKVTLDKKQRTVSIPATVNMRQGAVEYLLTTRQGKQHEAVLITDALPEHAHMASLLLDAKGQENSAQPESRVEGWIEWESNGPLRRVPLHEIIALTKGGPGTDITGTLPAGAWTYTGSRVRADGSFAATSEGTFISLIRDPLALINNPHGDRDNDDIHVPNAASLPPEGTPVTVVFQFNSTSSP